MKRAAIAAILATLLLTGCAATGGSAEAVTEYSSDYFTVTRQGRDMCITDAQTGTEYLFTTRRVKRPQDAAEAAERAKMRVAS